MGVAGCSRRCSKSTLLCAERKNCQKRCKDKNGQFLKHESSANEFLRTPASKLPQVVCKSHETGYPIHSQVPLPEGADHYPQVVRWTRASGTTGGKGEVPSLAKEGTSAFSSVVFNAPCPAKDVGHGKQRERDAPSA